MLFKVRKRIHIRCDVGSFFADNVEYEFLFILAFVRPVEYNV